MQDVMWHVMAALDLVQRTVMCAMNDIILMTAAPVDVCQL